MTHDDQRRRFLRRSLQAAGAASSLALLPASIRRALAIPASRRRGTIEDVEHIVVFMQENRSFDHYFGALHGVRGFADRFPIPVQDTPLLQGRTVWYQRADGGTPPILSPQHNDTGADFRLMRTADLPHLYPDAQLAWDGGRMRQWPQFKRNASMVYYTGADLPFQYALANAFTLCDANHCSFTGGTNPNRCYLFTGANHGRDDPDLPGIFNGPALDNRYNRLGNGPHASGYSWTTYAERLQAAGVSWQVYRPAAEDYALNSLLGFRTFREAAATAPAARTALQQQLVERGVQPRELGQLRDDVLQGKLPQVSWICATASGSEHPAASSPAQGAAYTAQVLDALTANPEVWSRTVLILAFDENDGFFDHVPPPAPPSYIAYHPDPRLARLAGASTVDAADEYLGEDTGGTDAAQPFAHHPYGMGPRVPLYLISPWSRGGWVNSQVFDQTSVIRFIERRFGVMEPNISAWRRAVAGDLTSGFDFAGAGGSDPAPALPDTAERDARSRTLRRTTTPEAAAAPSLPVQASGTRPSRALPYVLHVDAAVAPGADAAELAFRNDGDAAAVFHVYDRRHLDALPRRYTVEPGKALRGSWDLAADDGAYDLWVLGPAGFHRHFTGAGAQRGAGPEVNVRYDRARARLLVRIDNGGDTAVDATVRANAYFGADASRVVTIAAGGQAQLLWDLAAAGNWYDFTLTAGSLPGFARRFAGRLETGRHGISDPAMGGAAIGAQWQAG